MTARRMAMANACDWLRLARSRLAAGNLEWATFYALHAHEALGYALGASQHFQRTAGLRRLLDAFDKRLGAALAEISTGQATPAVHFFRSSWPI